MNTNASDRSAAMPECNAGTLTLALLHVARDAGLAVKRVDLDAALGVGWSPTAVPGEPDVSRWPLYARDAFVIPAGRLFGMTIRDVHPPEAARGLDRADEFRQHFDASYRPLVLRALEHGQTVLAWQGWAGSASMLWGIVTATCSDGVGFLGTVYDSKGDAQRLVLETPPVQLYVVENVRSVTPDAGELLATVMDHARSMLDNKLHDRFGVLTGPAAYDAWMDAVRRQVESGGFDPSRVSAHARAAGAFAKGIATARRFLRTHGHDGRRNLTNVARALDEHYGRIRAAFGSIAQFVGANGAQQGTGANGPSEAGLIQSWDDLLAKLAAAQTATEDALELLAHALSK